MSWTLQIGYTTHSLADWGIIGCVVNRANREPDKMTLTFAVENAVAEILSAGQSISLRNSGSLKFSGEVVVPAASFSGGGEIVQSTCMGRYFFLQKQVYLQKVLDGGIEADPDAVPPVAARAPEPVSPTRYEPEVTLFQNESAERISTIAQIQDILAQTNRIASSSLGGLTPGLEPVAQSGRSLSLREALDRCFNFHPKAVVTVSPSGVLTADETPPSLTIPFAAVASTLEIRERTDLKVEGVSILYENSFVGAAYPAPVYDDAGASGGEGVLYLAHDLQGVSEAPTGLSQHFLDQFSGQQWSVSLQIVSEECDPQAHLGKTLNISGGKSAWASMGVPIQSATYDIMAGVTSLQCDPMPVQSIDDMIELMRLRKYEIRQDESRAGGSTGGGSADNLKFTLDVYDTDAGEIVSVDLRKFQ